MRKEKKNTSFSVRRHEDIALLPLQKLRAVGWIGLRGNLKLFPLVDICVQANRRSLAFHI
jgi:hypothetical protein